jgi:hypothetical protein
MGFSESRYNEYATVQQLKETLQYGNYNLMG